MEINETKGEVERENQRKEIFDRYPSVQPLDRVTIL